MRDREDRRAPERRCIVSGKVLARAALIRFVVAPGGEVVCDVAEKLPGRGLWVAADADALAAADGRAFARAAKQPVTVPDDLPARVEAALVARLCGALGMARRAGALVAGFEKTRAALRSGKAAMLIAARDGAADGRAKLRALAPGMAEMAVLDGAEIGVALGRDAVVHAAVTEGHLAAAIEREARRLAGLRSAQVRGNELLDKVEEA